MSEEKLSSDEVPGKFTEWLLSMGCPLEKVPSVDKISQMCRGQYYMVWRSLMEHVHPKDIIKQKRLQVFCNDVKNCQKKYVYNKIDTPAVPEAVLLWREQTELKAKVAEAEQGVTAARQKLHELMDKISSKVAHRDISRKQVEILQRRIRLLTQVNEELKTKRSNLQETKAIAESLCTMHNDDTNVVTKVDKFLSTFERTSPQNMNASMFTANQTVIQHDNSDEEQLNSLLKCSSEAIWSQLLDRRKAIATKLAEYNAEPVIKQNTTSMSPQSVLSNTIALQCTLALGAMKNRAHTKIARNKLACELKELNIHQPEACELLVLQSELAEATARTDALKSTWSDLVEGAGVFEVSAERALEEVKMPTNSALDNKKQELQRLVSALSVTERKIQNVRDNLLTVFNAFYKDTALTEMDKYKGVQLDIPLESVSSLRKFYEDRSEKKAKKMELSLNFDVSDISFNDKTDFVNISFADELRMYMTNFNLEKNRKLVLESGEQMWISETLSSSLERFYKRLQEDDLVTSLMSPTQSIKNNLTEFLDELQTKADLEIKLNRMAKRENKIEFKLDIEKKKQEEEELVDKIKKTLSDDLQKLHNTGKLLEKGQENLRFWSENLAKNYISPERRVDGQTYKTAEALYIENLC